MPHLDPYPIKTGRLADCWISSVASFDVEIWFIDILLASFLEHLMACDTDCPWWTKATGINEVLPKCLSSFSRFFFCRDFFVPATLVGTSIRITCQFKPLLLQSSTRDPSLPVIESDRSLGNL
jgi:hypothetical protein